MNQPPDDLSGNQAGQHPWMPPKHPAWAFALNFFLPGAGLVYLGKLRWGIVNFITVVTLAAIIYWVLPHDLFEQCAPWLGVVFQVGSGLLAQWMANATES